jgi:hypothetical protein
MAENPWSYIVRVGWSDEFDTWVAQVLDDLGDEMFATHNESLSLALGNATAAVMEVEDELE